MQKLLFGIFAHPDDEAFGPAGTFISETETGAELHLVSLTLGDAGANPDNAADLGAVRMAEWHTGGKLMGATDFHYLGYRDGTLNNKNMIEISDKIIKLVKNLASDRDVQIDFITFDLGGITGHIDHIVAARATAYAYYSLKRDWQNIGKLRLFCLPSSSAPKPNIDWIFMEAGRTPQQIDETIDATKYNHRIRSVIRAHKSQRHDGESHISARGEQIGINNFVVLS